MSKFLWLVALAMATGTAACGTSEDSAEQELGASEGALAPRCGRRTAAPTGVSLSSMLDQATSVKLVTEARDPASLPTGARNLKYFKSLELKSDGKFKAKLNNNKRIAGEYEISSPRCPSNYEILTLGDDETDQLTFKVYRGKGRDFELPTRMYGFTGEGFTPFNMKVDGWEEPAPANEGGCTPDTAETDCEGLPRPRCFGAYVCEENACVWRSPVGGPRCGG